MLRRSFWPRHPSHKLHLFFQQWVTQHINSKKVTLSYPVQFGQVLVTIAGVETATYVSCETSNSNAIVEAVWFDSTYPDTNIVHVIAIGQ